jgi:hypothetical protein
MYNLSTTPPRTHTRTHTHSQDLPTHICGFCLGKTEIHRLSEGTRHARIKLFKAVNKNQQGAAATSFLVCLTYIKAKILDYIHRSSFV